MEGSATLTTLLSRIAMLEPRIVAIRVSCFAEEVATGEIGEAEAANAPTLRLRPRLADRGGGLAD